MNVAAEVVAERASNGIVRFQRRIHGTRPPKDPALHSRTCSAVIPKEGDPYTVAYTLKKPCTSMQLWILRRRRIRGLKEVLTVAHVCDRYGKRNCLWVSTQRQPYEFWGPEPSSFRNPCNPKPQLQAEAPSSAAGGSCTLVFRAHALRC